MDDIAAVILVGGKSSRMRQNKALLPYKGKRLVDVVAEVVRRAVTPKIYVSGVLEGYDSLPDLLAERGPVGGICSSAVRLHKRYARVLFIPVDMPLINGELLQSLVTKEQRAYHFDGHPLPCIIPLDRKIMRQIDTAAQALARKQTLSVKAFLGDMEARTISVPSHLKKILANTNTPEEWKEFTNESTHQ